jgi:hypothetical protein
MKPTLKTLVVVVVAFAIIGGMFSTSVPALAQTNSTDTATNGNPMIMGGCVTNNMTGTGGGVTQGPSGDAGETPGTLPPSEGLDAGETPPEGNMTTNSSGGT